MDIKLDAKINVVMAAVENLVADLEPDTLESAMGAILISTLQAIDLYASDHPEDAMRFLALSSKTACKVSNVIKADIVDDVEGTLDAEMPFKAGSLLN